MRVAALCGFMLASLAAPAQLQVLPGELLLYRAGQEHRLIAGTLSEGTWTGEAPVTFSIDKPEVAEVAADGTLRALGDGSAIVTAKSADGATATAAVTVSGAGAPFTWSFRNHVQPVLFKMGCSTGACHGSAAGKNGFRLSLRGYDREFDHRAITRQAKGRRISPGEPANSLILLKGAMLVPHEGGERFSTDSHAYARIHEWISNGAQPAREDEPVIEHIEVLPPRMTLKQGREQQLLVRAHYSDGSAEDVTEWASFSTSADTLLETGKNGLVKVIGTGAGAVSVYFDSKVAAAEISVPRDAALPEDLFARAPRNNYIDEHILRKLRELQIAPAGEIDDATFIRRAYIDTIGVLPTPEEVAAFRDDATEDKRARLADTLFARPEFVDYWTYKWSDLFILSSRNLSNAGELNAFYGFIRESVEQNRPWDAFAREVITASGNTLENGAAAYFVMHKEINDLTETTSQAFLGTSITCARCHNHPLEKWTQDQYYGMANLLSRVKLKNADNGGTVVLAGDFGDVLHPRIGRPMPPQPLDGEALPLDWSGDRRAQLAAWLTTPENPYFAKAIVNRVWANFMGRGLVESVDDLRLTNPPTHPDLLDALARDLIEHDFDLRHLMRQILGSAAYQRASEPADPAHIDGMYYAQYIVRRMPAEVILDSYAQVTAVPTPFPGYPDGTRALQLRDSQVASYFLKAFGRAERNITCTCERTDDASMAQTLHLSNGETLNEKLRNDGGIVHAWIAQGISDTDLMNRLFMRALGRYPDAREAEEARAVLAAAADTPETRREAVEDLAWALLSSKEFLFNH